MDTSGELKPGRDNPYVGPRPYTRKEENRFFGRERESRDLLSLVVSERLVLFYAQSGAGKTSLINTRLVAGLEGRNFEVLPVGRVSGELLPGQQVENIYVANLMLKLDMGEDDPSSLYRAAPGGVSPSAYRSTAKASTTVPLPNPRRWKRPRSRLRLTRMRSRFCRAP